MKTRYIVRFGNSTRCYFTRYHAEQLILALQMNGTRYTFVEVIK